MDLLYLASKTFIDKVFSSNRVLPPPKFRERATETSQVSVILERDDMVLTQFFYDSHRLKFTHHVDWSKLPQIGLKFHAILKAVY